MRLSGLCGFVRAAAVRGRFPLYDPSDREKSPVRLRTRLCDLLRSLRPDLNEIDERLGRLFQSLSRVELQLAMKIVAAGEKVRRRQSTSRQVRAVCAAADRGDLGRDARSFARLDRVIG